MLSVAIMMSMSYPELDRIVLSVSSSTLKVGLAVAVATLALACTCGAGCDVPPELYPI